MSKAIGNLVNKTSATPVDTKDIGAQNARPVTAIGSQELLEHSRSVRRGPLLTKTRTPDTTQENEHPSDNENAVFEVENFNYISKGEAVSANVSQENTTNLCVRGRLKLHLAFWERIEAPEFILRTITEGY